MKKILFFIVLSFVFTACASKIPSAKTMGKNGLYSRGLNAQSQNDSRQISKVRAEKKKEAKEPTIIKEKSVKKNGTHGNRGQKPPQPTSYRR